MPKTTPVHQLDAEDLTCIMATLEAAQRIQSEILEDFTEAFHPGTEQNYIALEWPRHRDKAWAVEELLRGLHRDLEALGARSGRPEQRDAEHATKLQEATPNGA